MTWTTPRTWVDAETPTAATMNTHIRDNMGFVNRAAYVTTTPVIVANTNNVSPIFDVTIPAGSMGTNGMARCVLDGNFLNFTSGDQFATWDIQLGGTPIWKDTFLMHNFNNWHVWRMAFTIACLASSSTKFMAGVFFMSMRGNTSSAGVGDLATYTPSADGPFIVPFGSDDTFSIDSSADVQLLIEVKLGQIQPDLQVYASKGYVELVGQGA